MLTLWAALGLGLAGAPVMGLVGLLALAANSASVLLPLDSCNGQANCHSVLVCSRSDAIGNAAVVFAALGVSGAGTA